MSRLRLVLASLLPLCLLLVLPAQASARSQVIYSGTTNCRDIALTYDAEFSDATQPLINMLDRVGVRTTWFFTGDSVDSYPSIVRQAARGHQIGNHTYSHPIMPNLSRESMRWQLQAAESSITRVAGENPEPLFRPPYGEWNNTMLEVTEEEGYPYVMMWSIDTRDWEGPSAETIRRRIVGGAFPGAIVLQHGFPWNTIEGARLAIGDLRNMGYQFLTLTEIMGIDRHLRDFGGDTYVVQSGDTFGWIGECHNLNGARIQAYNDVQTVPPGYLLHIPLHDEITVRLDGIKQEFPVYPRIRESRSVVHVRIAEKMGATVEWDGTSVIVTGNGKRILITPGQRTATVNGISKDMGAAAFMENDRVLAPVRFLAEELGRKVGWEADAWVVNITR